MNTTDNDATPSGLPIFPAVAPESLNDPVTAAGLFGPVIEALAAVVDIPTDLLDRPTPCAEFTVDQLRAHTVGWLQFFAQALADPAAEAGRPNPEAWQLPQGERAEAAVREAGATIDTAIAGGVADQLVVMSEARMQGGAVLAMALGEYIVHGWDLATATGQPWPEFTNEAVPALEFLRTTVSPEYRGPDTGFFDHETPAPDDATPLMQLLCFAGRDPQWAGKPS